MILRSKSKTLSLVDCTSFVVMRQLGLNTAFAFDKHFQLQGFRCLGRTSPM
jgi:predicted nucleic acid-binding protein